MPKISVIVPVYNVEKYLHECVDSILAQTFTDFELILINDGSQDSSGAICEEYAAKDKRITLIHQENQGQAAARNNAITIAQGEWIHFVDSDDVIHPQMLEILYDAVDETTKISMCGLCKGTELPDDFRSQKNDYSFKKCPVTEKELISMYNDFYQYWVVWAKLIKKEIVEKYLFTCGRIYEDTAVVFKWINETEFVNITDEQLDFPVVYASAKNGMAKMDLNEETTDLSCLFETIINTIHAPNCDEDGYAQMLVSNIDYDDYVGTMAVGRVERGKVSVGQSAIICKKDGKTVPAKTVCLAVHTPMDGHGCGQFIPHNQPEQHG